MTTRDSVGRDLERHIVLDPEDPSAELRRQHHNRHMANELDILRLQLGALGHDRMYPTLCLEGAYSLDTGSNVHRWRIGHHGPGINHTPICVCGLRGAHRECQPLKPGRLNWHEART